MVADARHEITRQRRKDQHPDKHDDCKPPVQPTDQKQHRDGINADEPDAFHQRGDEITRRLPARPDLGDDAAGEIVLEKGKRLPRHMHVGLPTHQIVKAGRDDLLVHQRRNHRDDKTHDADQHQHAHQLATMGGKQPGPALFRLHGRENIHQPPDEPEQRRLDGRRQPAQHQHGEKRRLGLRNIKPDESKCVFRRPQVVLAGEGPNPVLEELEDARNDHHPDIGGFPSPEQPQSLWEEIIFR